MCICVCVCVCVFVCVCAKKYLSDLMPGYDRAWQSDFINPYSSGCIWDSIVFYTLVDLMLIHSPSPSSYEEYHRDRNHLNDLQTLWVGHCTVPRKAWMLV